MKPLRHLIAICVLLLLSALQSDAIPARGGKAILRQPDGTEFTATLKGDEFFRLLTTADGHAIIQEKDGYYCYAVYDTDGRKTSTGYRVGSNVPESILASSKNIPYQTLMANAAKKKSLMQPQMQEALRKTRQRVSSPQSKAAGEPKRNLIILAEFSDVRFQYAAELKDHLSVNAAKYLNDQFGSEMFSFDVYGPATLTGTRRYYGENDGTDDDAGDKNAHLMVKEACKALDNEIDFSLYATNGEVGNVYVIFAGGDEAQYAGDDCIWSHAWALSATRNSITLDGVIIDQYACSSELATTVIDENYIATDFTLVGIGTFCHEFSHTLGLPDFYDTDYEKSGGEANALWRSTSLMDGGGYNNNGDTPPNYNAIEKEMLGIVEVQELVRQDEPYTINPIGQASSVYRIDGSVKNEYYLIECRYSTGWDKYIYVNEYGRNVSPDTGTMLIYHLDKSDNMAGYSESYNKTFTALQRWNYNEINANPKHECADLIEAAGSNIGQIFFPQKNVTSFTPTFWNKELSSIAITDITGNTDGTVTFNVKSTNISTGTTTKAFQDKVIISWLSNKGRNNDVSHIKIGTKPFDVSPDNDGIYRIIIGGLANNTEYTARIYFEDEASAEKITFKTTGYREGTFPFIYLKNCDRNSDGSFKKGTKVPLILFNALNLDEKELQWLAGRPADSNSVTWYFNDKEITRESDGYYTIPGNGILKAVIDLTDGGKDTIIKEITVK